DCWRGEPRTHAQILQVAPARDRLDSRDGVPARRPCPRASEHGVPMADVWDDDLIDAPAAATAPAAERIFLSPRVVDKAAFEEFAAALRGLIERASMEKAALATAASGAEKVLQSLADTTTANEEHLALAAKALATVE